MECSETWLEELAKQAHAIESDLTHLNVIVDDRCGDNQIQQAFTRIKADLRRLEHTVAEAIDHHLQMR